MKRITFRLALIVPAICMIAFLPACGGGEDKGDEQEVKVATVGQVSPEEEKVNGMPQTYFNKAKKVTQVASIEIDSTSNLTPVDQPMPKWLTALISRESIAVFANEILEKFPDEQEFVQSEERHFSGPAGWSGFMVNYMTRPGEISMIIYGAYKNENEVYWASESAKDGQIRLKSLAEVGGKPQYSGGIVSEKTGQKVRMFRAVLDKESVSMEMESGEES